MSINSHNLCGINESFQYRTRRAMRVIKLACYGGGGGPSVPWGAGPGGRILPTLLSASVGLLTNSGA